MASSRALVLGVVIWALAASGPRAATAASLGPEFVVRLDLSNRSDYRRAADLSLQPEARRGNVFYFVLGGADLAELHAASLEYSVIEDEESLRALNLFSTSRDEVAIPLGVPLGESTRFSYMEPVTASAASVFGNDPFPDAIRAAISRDSIVTYGRRLEGLQTRYTFSDSNDVAREYITGQLESFGYDQIETDTFYVSDWSIDFFHGPWGRNIICTKPGTLEPEKVVILGAHYDSFVDGGLDPFEFAPGGDRNASGTAAVLEAARVLVDIPTRKTIIFAFFGAGEQDFAGSERVARRMAEKEELSVELMINLDRIAFANDSQNDLHLSADPESAGYVELAMLMAASHSRLKPGWTKVQRPSNWRAFRDQGIRWLDFVEGDGNPFAVNSVEDQVDRLNERYWTEAVRVATTTTYAVAASPSAVQNLELWDVGDGTAIEARWSPLAGSDIVGHRIYWGAVGNRFPEHILIPSGDSSAVIQGLEEGAEYSISVTALTVGDLESAVRPQATIAPLTVPRAPGGLFADPEFQRIELSWDRPPELDLDHYVIYRGSDSTNLSVLTPEWRENHFTDSGKVDRVRYHYRVASVDRDGNVSDLSANASTVGATFDRGVLIISVTSIYGVNPDDSEQEAFYRDVFRDYRHAYHRYDDYGLELDKAVLGSFRVLIWIDDDDMTDRWSADRWAKLNWYMDNGNDIVFAGWQTARELANCRRSCAQQEGDFLLDRLDIFHVSAIPEVDCVGGYGVSNYPDVVFDTAKVLPQWDGMMGFLWGLHPQWPATLTLTYRSGTDDDFRTGFPVGVRRGWKTNKLAMLTLPLYYLRAADARAYMTAVIRSFDQPTLIPGDLDSDASATLSDITYIVDVIYRGLVPVGGYEYVDFNGDCSADILDIVGVIDFILHDGPEPVRGCAQ